MKTNDPEQWVKWGQRFFVVAVIYYGWTYIVMALAICGGYYVWLEW